MGDIENNRDKEIAEAAAAAEKLRPPPLPRVHPAKEPVSATLSWQTLEGLMDLLEERGLLGEKFLYTAISPDDIPKVQHFGTYVFEEGRAQNEVYCTQLTEHEGEKTLAQPGSEGIHDIWDYVNQNASMTEVGIVVFHRDALRMNDAGGALFHFRDAEKATDAIAEIIRVELK